MDGDVVVCQLLHQLHCVPYIIECFLGKSHDEVHVYVVKAQLTRELEALYRIVYRVVSSYYIECLLLHGLRID